MASGSGKKGIRFCVNGRVKCTYLGSRPLLIRGDFEPEEAICSLCSCNLGTAVVKINTGLYELNGTSAVKRFEATSRR